MQPIEDTRPSCNRGADERPLILPAVLWVGQFIATASQTEVLKILVAKEIDDDHMK